MTYSALVPSGRGSLPNARPSSDWRHTIEFSRVRPEFGYFAIRLLGRTISAMRNITPKVIPTSAILKM